MYQCTKCHSQERKPNQVMAINILVYKFLMPEAICCCLQLVNVVLTLEWYCVPVYQVS